MFTIRINTFGNSGHEAISGEVGNRRPMLLTKFAVNGIESVLIRYCTYMHTIEGSLTTAPGFNCIIIAGNEIVEGTNSEVAPEIERKVVHILDHSHPMPKADQSYVTQFCKGNSYNAPEYKANLGSKILLAAQEKEKQEEKQGIQQASESWNWDVELYPNPATKEIHLSFTGAFDRTYQLQIVDLSGKSLLEKTIYDTSIDTINISTFNKGVYLIKINSNGVQKLKRLVVL